MTCLFWLKFLDPKRQVKFFFGCESGPLMSHKVLVHTSDKVLHPGARHDFQRHVESLVKHGQRETAAELWSAVAEVQHLPVPEVPVLDITKSWVPWQPLFARSRSASGAGSIEEAIASRGLADGQGVLPCRRRGLTLLEHGMSGPVVRPDWTCCNLPCTIAAGGYKTFCHLNGPRCCRELRGSQGVLPWAGSLKCGEHGSWARQFGLTRSQCQLLLGQRHWLGIGAGHIGPCFHGWMLTRPCCCRGSSSSWSYPRADFLLHGNGFW